MNDARDEIRARLPIEDLIGEYLELRRAGRNFKALSPWTNERTPSFVVSPEKQIWHDFSSGKGGDIFSFMIEIEGMSYREALEFLARKTGVELQQFDSVRSQQLAKRKKTLYEILNLSANFFQHYLVQTPEALDYVFKQRRLSKEIVQQFKIGYAPTSRDILVRFLQKKGYSLRDIKDAGMLNQYNGDIFRGRMVISLQDLSGAPVGFTGRILKDEPNSPKYLNTPQTILYDKSNNVFGLFQAKNYIRKAGFAVIVEGNMDVISSHQAGVKNVVATAGTAITARHLKTLSRFSGDIRICFDSDDAGIKATERAIILSQEVGVDVSIVSLDQSLGEVKDPDELIQRDVGLWQKSIEKPQPALEWVLDQYEKRLDTTSAAGKKQFSTTALKLVENLNDPVEKEFYIAEIAQRINSSPESIIAKFKDKPPVNRPKKHIKVEKTNPQIDNFIYEDDLLALAIMDQKLADMLEDLPKNALQTDERNQLLNILKQNQRDQLKNHDNYVKILLLKADERYSSLKEKATIEMQRLINKVKFQHLNTQKNILQQQLEDAEIQGDEQLKMKILSEIIKLNKELNSGKK